MEHPYTDFVPFYYETFLPHFEQKVDAIKTSLNTYINAHRIEKKDWTDLLIICEEISRYIAENKETGWVTFDPVRLESVKYRSSHSQYYEVHSIAIDTAKHCLNQLTKSDKYPDNFQMKLACLWIAATHLFFFITMKEKL